LARGAVVAIAARGALVAGRMGAGPAAVALIERARIAVAGARRAWHGETAVGSLVARVGAFRPAGAWIAGVGAGAPAADVGAVAEEAVVARRGVVRVRARAGAVASVVRARVAVAGAGGSWRPGAVLGGPRAR